MMLGRWDERKGLSRQSTKPQAKDFLLQRLAFQMHLQAITSIPLSTCKEVFRTNLEERGYEADVDTSLMR